MAETSIFWLRVTALFYSVGLLHAAFSLLRPRQRLFRIALPAFAVGGILHLVTLVETTLLNGAFPLNNFYESISVCAFLTVALFLVVHWRYNAEGMSVFIFPLVFVMTLIAGFGNPVGTWASASARNAWLIVHVMLILTGYAALLFTAAAAVLYLAQENDLKQKRSRKFLSRMPALGQLDDLISKSMAIGFLSVTLGVIAGCSWAFIELGTRWIAEPKIGIAFATWAIYMAMVFLRVSAGWRGRKAAFMALTALGCSTMTWVAHTGLRTFLAR